jgi:hypothetical protein
MQYPDVASLHPDHDPTPIGAIVVGTSGSRPIGRGRALPSIGVGAQLFCASQQIQGSDVAFGSIVLKKLAVATHEVR